jgi:hypothetical protein
MSAEEITRLKTLRTETEKAVKVLSHRLGSLQLQTDSLLLGGGPVATHFDEIARVEREIQIAEHRIAAIDRHIKSVKDAPPTLAEEEQRLAGLKEQFAIHDERERAARRNPMFVRSAAEAQRHLMIRSEIETVERSLRVRRGLAGAAA